MSRTSGILCHPTSLPGALGAGSVGAPARRFLGALSDMGQTWWQMLPVGPTGYGNSPYQSPSTFAGNPLLIDLADCVSDGLIEPECLSDHPPFTHRHVDFPTVLEWREPLLEEVTARFPDRAPDELREEREAFRDVHGGVWLDDFAVFTALKRHHELRPWWQWEAGVAAADPSALATARRRLRAPIEAVVTEQYLFDRYFRRLRREAEDAGIGLIGDIPIFVAHDSADVWSNRELFHLDDDGMPTVVAGVPPDYFSATGQRWGNPLYRWDRHRETDFEWWTQRMRRVFDLYDLVRVDHFRGFAAAWHIPADEPTAVRGEWVQAPGGELFSHLTARFGRLDVIAEDLGVITPDVVALRKRFDLPGMKVLQFGFGTESDHALAAFTPEVVAYTGTHDNDTAIGWWEDDDPDREREREWARAELGTDGSSFHWDMIAAVAGSVAETVVFPLQDPIGLGSHARMNLPGTIGRNWEWRFTWEQLSPEIISRMRRVTEAADRTLHLA